MHAPHDSRQPGRSVKIEAILREICEAADRLQPITAAINRGDVSRIAESERIQREIEALYDRRAALWPGDDKRLQP
jgi:hypothetical protein